MAYAEDIAKILAQGSKKVYTAEDIAKIPRLQGPALPAPQLPTLPKYIVPSLAGVKQGTALPAVPMSASPVIDEYNRLKALESAYKAPTPLTLPKAIPTLRPIAATAMPKPISLPDARQSDTRQPADIIREFRKKYPGIEDPPSSDLYSHKIKKLAQADPDYEKYVLAMSQTVSGGAGAGPAKSLYAPQLNKALGGDTELYEKVLETAKEAHPTAYAAGKIAGEVGKTVAESQALGALLSSFKWFVGLPKLAQASIRTGLLFGGQSGVKTAAQGGTPGEIAKETTIGTLKGVAAGPVGEAISAAGANILFKYGLQNSIPLNAAVKTVAGSGFSLAGSGTEVGARYLTEPDYQADPQQIAQDAITMGAFWGINSFIDSARTSSGNKAYMQKQVDDLKNAYAQYETAKDIATPDQLSQINNKILTATENLRGFMGANQFLGAQKDVKEAYKFLDLIQDSVIANPSGINAPAALGAGQSIPPSSALAPNLPAVSAPPTQPIFPQISGALTPAQPVPTLRPQPSLTLPKVQQPLSPKLPAVPQAPAPPLAAPTLQRPIAPDSQNINVINQDLQNVASPFKQVRRDAYQHLVSGQSPLERMSKVNQAQNPNIDAAVQLARQSGGTVDFIAEKGLVNRSGQKTGQSYVSLMSEIPRAKLAEFNDYAQNLHNIDRMSLESKADVQGAIDAYNQFANQYPEVVNAPEWQISKWVSEDSATGELARGYKEIIRNIETQKAIKNKPVNANTAEQSAEIVKRYEQTNPQFRKTIEDIQKWWDTFGREWMVDSGLVSEEGYNRMREMYPYYVPTFRVEKQGSFGSGLFGKSVSTPGVIQKATGGIGEIVPLEESFMSQINRTVRAARRNELGQSLLEFARSDPKKAALTGIRLAESEGKVSPTDLDGFLDSVDNKTLQELENGGYRLTVLENGEKINLDISRDVWQGLKLLQDSGLTDSFLTKLGKTLTKPSKTAITGINALFAVTNTVRDFQTYYVNSIANNPLTMVSNYGRAAWDVLKSDALSKLPGIGSTFDTGLIDTYKGLGGSRSGFYGSQAGYKGSLPTPFKELSFPKKAGKVLGSPFELMAKLGEFTEQVPRMAEYRNALKKYGDTPEGRKKAALAAADVTVNFSRGGPDIKKLDAWTMYLNAQVQGLDKMARQIKNRPIATFGKAAQLITLATALLYLANHKNPHYEELDDRTKDAYFIIPNEHDLDKNGNAKTFIKLPKSREYGALLGASFDRIMQYIETGDAEESFRGYGSTVATNLLPSNPLTDSYLAPLLINIPSNKDFAGRAIVPRGMEDLSPKYQYDINTSGVAKVIGEQFNLSPKQIDYLISSYAGYPGQLLQAATSPQNKGNTPLETAQNAARRALVQPFERRFTADPLYSSALVDRFYNALDKATTAAKDKNFSEDIPPNAVTPEEKRVSYLNKASLQISELRKQEKEILAQPGAAISRKIDIDKIRYQINEVAKNALLDVEKHVAEYEKTYVPEISHLSEKQQEAAKALYESGVQYKQFISISGELKKFTPKTDANGKITKTAVEQQRQYLFDMQGMTPEVKAQIDQLLIQSGDSKKNIDYRNEYGFQISQWNEDAQEKARTAKAAGISSKDYITIRSGMDTDKNGGITQEEAQRALDRSSLSKKQKLLCGNLSIRAGRTTRINRPPASPTRRVPRYRE